jgi:hypothetical protein
MTLVDDMRRQINERLNELQPLVGEYHELEGVIAKLDSAGGGSTTTGRRRPAASTRARSTTRTTRSRSTRRRRGRPRGEGSRSVEALALVQSKPGITIPEMGKEMGITPNYLYRVLPELAKDGKVKKQGKGWVPA